MSVVAPPQPPRPDELEALIREARERQRQRRLLAAAVVGILAAVGLSVWAAVPRGTAKPSHSTRSARGAPIPQCSPAQLDISLPRRFAGLGHINGDLRFTNTSGARCRLSGWPTVTALEANGAAIPAKRIPKLSMAWALSWPQARRVRPVILARGQSAVAEIDGSDIALGNGRSPCSVARRLRVAAPGGHRSVTLSALWWRSAGRPVYYPLCAGISVSSFFPPSALPR
jgi:Protein of unknown function (DUF4232)